MKNRFSAAATSAALYASLIVLVAVAPLAQAGPGLTPATSNQGVPVLAPTYYANSPLGLRPDLAAAPGALPIDTGTAMRKFIDILPSIPGIAPTTNAGSGVIGGVSKYMTLAVPEVWPTDLADYYHLAVVE